MNEYEKNLERLELLKAFKGGDNEDIPLHCLAIRDMKYIVEQCKKNNLPQPEIFPWSGGHGIQAEWEYDWYLEIDSEFDKLSAFFVEGNDYDNAISINDINLGDAFNLVKVFLNYVVDLNGKR